MSDSAHLLERIVYTLDMPRETLAWADTGMLVTSDNALKYLVTDNIIQDGKVFYPEGGYLYPTCPLVDFYAIPLCLQSFSGLGTGFLAVPTADPLHPVPFSFVFCFVEDGF